MSDLKKYIASRKEIDSEFREDFKSGYQEFNVAEILQEVRKDTGLRQKQTAEVVDTQKSGGLKIKKNNRMLC